MTCGGVRLGGMWLQWDEAEETLHFRVALQWDGLQRDGLQRDGLQWDGLQWDGLQ